MNLAAFDLNLLRVLDALLQEHSTVKAGERIGLSQPAVSAALNRLRHALNDPLFVRQGQQFVPTDFARSLELPLRRIIDDLEAVLSGPDAFDPMTATHSFMLSGSDFFAELLMPPLADELSVRAPKIRVQQVDLVPDNYVGTLANHEIDLALIPEIEFPDWIDFLPVSRSNFVMIARNGHPRLMQAGVKPGQVVPVDLYCDLSHILFSPEGNLKGLGDAALQQIGRERRVVMTMPVFGGICNAVAGSDRVALLPEQLAVKKAGQLGFSLYRPPMPIDTVQLCMIWHKRYTSDRAHRWLRELVAEILSRLAGPAFSHKWPSDNSRECDWD